MWRFTRASVQVAIALTLISFSAGVPVHVWGQDVPARKVSGPGTLPMWDAAFGNDGFVTTNFDRLQTFSDITDLIVQPDGKLLSAVRSCQDAHGYTSGCGMLVLARTNSEGAIDTPFGTNGVISTPLSFYLPASAVSAGQHVALQPNGMIVVGGSIQGKPALVQPAENKRQVQPRRFARKVAECNLSVNFRKLY